MISHILTVVVAGYILFELIEHVLFPLVWSFTTRKRKSLCGNEAMLGKMVKVTSWRGGEGRVLVDGEIWNASSEDQFQPGDKAVVQKVDGLVLALTSINSEKSLHGSPGTH